jgi:hypothetical protein
MISEGTNQNVEIAETKKTPDIWPTKKERQYNSQKKNDKQRAITHYT